MLGMGQGHHILHIMLMRGWVIFLALLLALHSVLLAQAPTSAPVTTAPAAVILVQGEINDYQYDFVTRQFAQARRDGATTVILEIDSYGGLVTSGLDISRFLKQQRNLHIIAYVTDKAISAGAMIAMACDEIVMAPGTVIGDCEPIAMLPGGGMQSLAPAERAKIESPVLADFMDSAERNHHDPVLAEAMVRLGPALYLVEKSEPVPYSVEKPRHEQRIVTQEEYDQLVKEQPQQWKTPEGFHNPFRPDNTLLTVPAQTAARIGLAGEVCASADQLAAQRNLRIVADLRPGIGDHLIGLLSEQSVRSLIFFVLLISGYMAFKTPGTGLPEAVAAISLIVLLGVPLMTGYAQWYEIIMVLAGIALVAIEIFVLPGHMIPGILGLGLVVVGIVMTFVGREPPGMPGFWPELPETYSSFESGLVWVTATMAMSLITMIALSRVLPKTPYMRRLVLTATTGGSSLDAHNQPTDLPAWPAVGAIGTAVTELRPGGTAAFADPQLGDLRQVDVISDSGYIPAGTKIVAREVATNHIMVRQA